MTDRLPDPGVQNERTALAWQRTALALLVGGLIAVRVVAARAPVLAVVVAATTVLPAVLIVALAWQRYHHAGRAFADHFAPAPRARDPAAMPDGRLQAITAGVVAVLCLLELAHLVLG